MGNSLKSIGDQQRDAAREGLRCRRSDALEVALPSSEALDMVRPSEAKTLLD